MSPAISRGDIPGASVPSRAAFTSYRWSDASVRAFQAIYSEGSSEVNENDHRHGLVLLRDRLRAGAAGDPDRRTRRLGRQAAHLALAVAGRAALGGKAR